MATKAKRFIPEQYHTLTPYLVLSNAAATMEFYKKAFGATELYRMPMPNGRIGHAEMKIGDSIFMMADENPEMSVKSPLRIGGAPVGLMIYVEDCDQVFQRALSVGAALDRPLQDQFYGDRSGTVVDPSGHRWTIATHKEDVSPQELNDRLAAMSK